MCASKVPYKSLSVYDYYNYIVIHQLSSGAAPWSDRRNPLPKKVLKEGKS